ncbi:MAG: tRNA (adenosine(37)-N6)-dimethylallyltransferase MiaA [Clostridia bacterium]|nr:tRNA (adenosine(37)-N6)-dimethylallyltransferase MiaA [Clostridia bacterium]
MSKLFIVTGPTAVGKSESALTLAKAFDTGIISCDSMQIYRGMDIGTAKPTQEERALVPHYLIDYLHPDTAYSTAAYVQDFDRTVKEHFADKTPIVTGGTGLYINAILYPYAFANTADDPVLRAELQSVADTLGAEALHGMLAEIDPASAQKLHPNDVRRVIRAIEIFRCTGKRKSEGEQAHQAAPRYEYRLIVLTRPREELYRRIDERVDMMMRDGLWQEVLALKEQGVLSTASSMQAIGYKELYEVIDGKASLEEAVALIKKRSRNYAKRQMTFFRGFQNATFMELSSDTVQRLTEEYRAFTGV